MENNLKRIKTGISNFDELIEGGFPVGSNVLVSGTPGSGKTIFSMEYIINGAVNNNEFGIYFTFEEKRESLIMQAKQFGWDIEKLEKEKKLKFISIGTYDISENTVFDILDIIKTLKAKRVVIDSLTTLSFLLGNCVDTNNLNATKFLYSFVTGFKELSDVTPLFISQKSAQSTRISAYVCDGIINFESESLGGNYSRNLSVKKMRSTKNNDDLHPFEIKGGVGINIHSFK